MIAVKTHTESLGVKASTTRAYPHCIFNKSGLGSCSRCSVGYSTIFVNPNLTIFPCVSLFYKGPMITTIQNPRKFIREFYGPLIYDLKWKRYLFENCKNCIHHVRKKCQGTCLTYKVKKFNIVKSERYKIYSQFEEEQIQDFVANLELILNKSASNNKKMIIYILKTKEEMEHFSGERSIKAQSIISNNIYYQVGNGIPSDLMTKLNSLKKIPKIQYLF
jgi:hypothetical protein